MSLTLSSCAPVNKLVPATSLFVGAVEISRLWLSTTFSFATADFLNYWGGTCQGCPLSLCLWPEVGLFQLDGPNADKHIKYRRQKPWQLSFQLLFYQSITLINPNTIWEVIIFISTTHIKQEFILFMNPTSISVIRHHFHQQIENIYLNFAYSQLLVQLYYDLFQ